MTNLPPPPSGHPQPADPSVPAGMYRASDGNVYPLDGPPAPGRPSPLEPVAPGMYPPSDGNVYPQQGFHPQMQPPPRHRKGKGRMVALIVIASIVALGGVLAAISASRETSQVAVGSGKCDYVPKRNYKQNEGLYDIWRDRVKKVDFDVYLPCRFPKDSVLHELGIGGDGSDDVVSVFLTLRPESRFRIRALPSNVQPPATCFDHFSNIISAEVRTIKCTKAGDSKFGPVYTTLGTNPSLSGNLSLVIGTSLITWDFPLPRYDGSGDLTPQLEIINSLQKVEPSKLEFFNG